MKIGSVELASNVILAPMAGFSTPAFRRLCKEHGAGLTVSEMVCSEGVLRGNKTTLGMIERAENETPFSIQLFGSEPKRIALAGEALERKCELLDLNFGCPALHVSTQGAGAALLGKPEKIAEIIHATATTLSIPVTAKIRLGVRTKTNCVAIAKLIEKNGAQAITVHARTAKQNYSKKADWQAIREIKEALSIPVIGNGDVLKPEDAEKIFNETKCDGVMIGRGALGNPFIFKQMNDYFEKGEYELPTSEERTSAFLQFLNYSQGNPLARVRMQAFHFTKGLKNAGETRKRMMKAKNLEELKLALE